MLHIIFTSSGAGILRQALRTVARKDRVIVLDDPLFIGPIDPPDPASRLAWMIRHLGVLSEDWDWLPEFTERFWAQALAAEDPIVWTTRRSAREYCGFLEWAWRCGDRPYRLVDVTHATFVNRMGTMSPILSISQVAPELLDIGELIDSARRSEIAERDAIRRSWEVLRAENSELRIVVDEHIVSARSDHFDALLLAGARPKWLKTARIIGEAMANADSLTIPTTDIYFGGRVAELVRIGALEAQGDIRRWRHSEVRLPQAIRPIAIPEAKQE